jgi:tryptophan-rich hypothetical protein
VHPSRRRSRKFRRRRDPERTALSSTPSSSASGTTTVPTPLSPKKLLHTKWTAADPRNREKHFLVTKVIEPRVPGAPIEFVEVEAVYTKRASVIRWRELQDPSVWRQGWS